MHGENKLQWICGLNEHDVAVSFFMGGKRVIIFSASANNRQKKLQINRETVKISVCKSLLEWDI